MYVYEYSKNKHFLFFSSISSAVYLPKQQYQHTKYLDDGLTLSTVNLRFREIEVLNVISGSTLLFPSVFSCCAFVQSLIIPSSFFVQIVHAMVSLTSPFFLVSISLGFKVSSQIQYHNLSAFPVIKR